MKKKLLPALLVLLTLLMLVPGCAPEPDAAPETEQTSSLPSDEAAPAEPAQHRTVPEYQGGPLLEADPDRDFYCTLANQDCDIYAETFCGKGFYILTTQPHKVQVKFSMRTQCVASVRPVTEDFRRLDYSGFSVYHYLLMQGTDWNALGQAMLDSGDAESELARLPITDERRAQAEAVCAAYQEKVDQYGAEYAELTEEDIPELYVYAVDVLFMDLTDPKKCTEETVTELTLQLDDKSYTVPFGQWRIHTSMPKELEADGYGVSQQMVALGSLPDSAYSGGYAMLPEAFLFEAQKDLTITGARCLGADVELLGGRVRLRDAQGANVTDYFWDGTMPVEIPAGQTVALDILLYDERFAQYEVGCTVALMMDYEINGKAHSMMMPCDLTRYNSVWDTYLMAFAGIDVGEFYTCFYLPQFADYYMDKLPESWRR